MPKYPTDQFDELPRDLARVGAHRLPPRRGRVWVRVAWAALCTGLLVGVGLIALALVNDSFRLDLPGLEPVASGSAEPSAPATAEPVTDPASIDPALAASLTITVLNGSPVDDLQNTVGDSLADAGWPVGARNNADPRDVETTTVYYNDPAFEGIARGVLAATGGIGDVELSQAFLGAPVTVVLGADQSPSEGA